LKAVKSVRLFTALFIQKTNTCERGRRRRAKVSVITTRETERTERGAGGNAGGRRPTGVKAEAGIVRAPWRAHRKAVERAYGGTTKAGA
jgi:hypothetical protein